MAPVQSKTSEVSDAKATPATWDKKRRDAFVRSALLHTFQSVAQHVVLIQSELMLLRDICGGDMAQTARYLANTQGLAGLLGLFFNQVGSKLSDVKGRKPFLMLGPLCNILCGWLVYKNPLNKSVVLACRIVRGIMTTFSNTVMVMASTMDVLPKDELATVGSLLRAVIGAGIVVTPFVEAAILQRTKNPKFSYLLLSGMAALQAAISATSFPETLQEAKAGVASWLSELNPFDFMSIYTRASKALRGMVTITTFQQLIDGKNMSDITEIWKRNHLKMTVSESRNFIVGYGTMCALSGALLGPRLVAGMTNRGYTSFTNLTNTLAFLIRGTERKWLFILAALPMLPGVNGSSALKLQARCQKLAREEGFFPGEFSAWLNNLRALASVVCPVLIGNYYSWCLKSGFFPGSVYWLLGFMGAVAPELLLRRMSNAEIEDAPEEAEAGKKAVK